MSLPCVHLFVLVFWELLLFIRLNDKKVRHKGKMKPKLSFGLNFHFPCFLVSIFLFVAFIILSYFIFSFPFLFTFVSLKAPTVNWEKEIEVRK